MGRIGLNHRPLRRISFSTFELLICAKKLVASVFVQGLMRIELAFSHRKPISTEGRDYQVFLLTINEGDLLGDLV